MAQIKLSLKEWAEYLDLYRQLGDRLSREPWFGSGWETRFDYLNKENPTGAWMRLIRGGWFDGAIHLETWVNNAVIERGATPVVLHIETSMAKHGLSRNDFSRVFLEKEGSRIAGWEGYTVKPHYAMEPFSVQSPFTKETLVDNLQAEFNRLQILGQSIDETIRAVQKG